MSVEGEYSRTLEALLALLRGIEHGVVEKKWTTAFTAARIGPDGDLSRAASHCLDSLESFRTTRRQASRSDFESAGDPLEESLRHLKVHCTAILGATEEPSDPDDKPTIGLKLC